MKKCKSMHKNSLAGPIYKFIGKIFCEDWCTYTHAQGVNACTYDEMCLRACLPRVHMCIHEV